LPACLPAVNWLDVSIGPRDHRFICCFIGSFIASRHGGAATASCHSLVCRSDSCSSWRWWRGGGGGASIVVSSKWIIRAGFEICSIRFVEIWSSTCEFVNL
jgi:hypothetical protein